MKIAAPPILRGAVTSALAVVVVLLAIAAGSAKAATLEPVGSYESPVFVTSDPTDPDVLFVVEQAGRIQVDDGSGARTFLDIRDDTGSDGEAGLLSMAFDPGYGVNGRFYTYSVSPDGETIKVDEFTATGPVADSATRRPLLRIPHPAATNHYGGQLQIGPDDLLYISVGDANVGDNAQDTSKLLGKILRIDPDPDPTATAPYGIPPTNPFAGSSGRDEIWSYGFRNPFRFSFDRRSGDLVIGDVGEQEWEEVDLGRADAGGGRGLNYGWDCREGAHDFRPEKCAAGAALTGPVFEYPHSDSACSITGGYVSRDPGTSELAGRYLYADFCGGVVRSVDLDASSPAATDRSEGLAATSPTSFGEDSCGRLYVVARGGEVSRIVGDRPTDCPAPPVEPPPPTPSGDREGTVCGAPGLLGTSGDDSFRGGDGVDRYAGLAGDDRILGSGGSDCLLGNAGEDFLRGGRGSDRLRGGAADDRLNGGRGPDRLKGSGGADRLAGARGADRIRGDGGRDRIKAGKGRDRINARGGGRDVVRCGRGRDTARVDRRDRVRGCERVKVGRRSS